MAIGAEWVAAGANIAGGLMGRSSNRKALQAHELENQRDREYNERLQKEFAQNGIRWKVEDAKAAGLHPLFALGGGGAAFSPGGSGAIPVFNDPLAEGISRAGQDISRAAKASATAEEKAAHALQLEALSARTQNDLAQAQYWQSKAALNEQDRQRARAIPVTVDGRFPESHPLFEGQVELNRDTMVSHQAGERGITAAPFKPALSRYALPGGQTILLPSTDGGEFPEDISLAGYLAAIAGNWEEGGWRKLISLMGSLTGQSPDYRRKRGTLESWLRNKFKQK